VHGQTPLHHVAGLAVTFIEAPRLIQSVQALPSTHQYVCELQGIPKKGNCAGILTEVWDSTECATLPDPPTEYG
jgi:iron transport multicopper oxidase